MRTISFLLTTVIILISSMVSASAVPERGSTTPPPSPELVPFSENICEDDWQNVVFAIQSPDPSYEYLWGIPTELEPFTEFNDNKDRILISDISPLLDNPLARIFVQAKNDCGESFPTVLNIRLIKKLDLPALPLDTSCVGRAVRIDPYRTNVGAIETWDWDFGPQGEVSSGETDTGDEFFAKFLAEGTFEYMQTVTDTFGCQTSQTYTTDVFNAPPFPEIVPCPYMGTDSVFFEWTVNNQFDYTTVITPDPLPSGAVIVDQTENSLLVGGLTPGQNIIVTVTTMTDDSPAPCNIEMQSLACRSCLPAVIDFAQVDRLNFCVGDADNFPIELIAEVNATNYPLENNPAAGRWDLTADGVVEDNGAVFFDPAGLAPGTYSVEYEYFHPDDNCPWNESVNFTIYERPIPNASLDKNSTVTSIEVCSDEEVIVYYDRISGLPKPDIFFDGGTGGVMQEARSKNSELFTFPNTAATYEITVRYQIPDCEPIAEVLTVNVVDKPEIIVECGPEQSNSVTVEWNTIENTTAYDVYLDGSFFSTVQNDNQITIGALDVDNTYEIIVEALALGCGSIRDTAVCMTSGCVAPTVDLTNVSSPFCYDPSEAGVLLEVDVMNATANITGDYTWDTNGIGTIDDKTFTPEVGVEVYFLDLLYEDETGCTYTEENVEIVVITQPEAPLVIDGPDEVCLTVGTVSVASNYQAIDPLGEVTYIPTWPASVNATESAPGEYLLRFDEVGEFDLIMQVSYKGCLGPEVTTKITVTPPPVITVECLAPEELNAITIEWSLLDDVTIYDIYLDNDLFTTVVNGNQLRLDGLDTRTSYEVRVEAFVIGCGTIMESAFCMTSGCEAPTIDLAAVANPFCYSAADGPILLEAEVMNADPALSGTYIWDNNGVGTLEDDNLFTPEAGTEVYLFDLIYEDETGCTYREEDIEITVITVPEAALVIDGPAEVCLTGGEVMVSAVYPALDPTATVTYIPTFPLGVNATETAEGEYLLSFDREGVYDLGMQVEYMGCTGPEVMTEITVVPAPAFNLMCGVEELNAVTVDWTSIAGVTSYDLYVDDAFHSTVENDNQQRIEPLAERSLYEVRIEAMVDGCGLVTETVFCSTGGCEDPTVDLTAVASPLCYDPTTGPVLIEAVVANADPSLTGDYMWENLGAGMLDDLFFTPEAGIESYALDLIYEDETGCIFRLQDVAITIITAPEAPFVIDGPMEVCATEEVFVKAELDVLDPSEVTYIPTFPTGVNAVEQATAGEYLLSFDADAEGDYDLVMQVIYQGCPGPEVMTTITVQPAIAQPVVTCTPGFGSVVLEWENIPNCVSSYEATINGIARTVSTTSVELGPLEAGEIVEYSVTALSNCLCPDAEITGNCDAVLACPDIVIDAPAMIDTCWNPTLAPFELGINVTPSVDLPMSVEGGVLEGFLINAEGLVDLSLAPFDDDWDLTYTYAQGFCTETAIINVALHNPPTLDSIQTFMPDCIDDELGMVIVNIDTETGTPDFEYSIDGGQSYQLSPTFEEVPLGPFIINVKDAVGCVVDGVGEISPITDIPTVTLDGPDLVVEGNEAVFTISTNIDRESVTNIFWILDGEIIREGANLFEITIDDITVPGNVMAEIEFGSGCAESDSKEFDVNQLQSIYIPNMVDFSGRSTSPNNAWTVYVKGDEVFVSKVLIFDRWGNKVKDFENIAMDYFKELLIWDGNFGSVPADQGVYTYVIEVEIEGRPEIKRGSITVLR